MSKDLLTPPKDPIVLKADEIRDYKDSRVKHIALTELAYRTVEAIAQIKEELLTNEKDNISERILIDKYLTRVKLLPEKWNPGSGAKDIINLIVITGLSENPYLKKIIAVLEQTVQLARRILFFGNDTKKIIDILLTQRGKTALDEMIEIKAAESVVHAKRRAYSKQKIGETKAEDEKQEEKEALLAAETALTKILKKFRERSSHAAAVPMKGGKS